MPSGGGDQRANCPHHPHFQAAAVPARNGAVPEGENHAALEGFPESGDPFDGCSLAEAEVAGGKLDLEVSDGVEAAQDLGGGIGQTGRVVGGGKGN